MEEGAEEEVEEGVEEEKEDVTGEVVRLEYTYMAVMIFDKLVQIILNKRFPIIAIASIS